MISRTKITKIIYKLLISGLLLLLNSPFCFSEPVIREVKENEYIVRLDLSSQVLSLDVQEEKQFSAQNEKEVKRVETQIYPDLKSIPQQEMNLVSAAIIAQKVKSFNDGLLGAVEYLCQNGTDKITGKKEITRRVLSILQKIAPETEDERKANRKCQAMLYAAMVYGGQQAKVDKSVEKIAYDLTTLFMREEYRFKPIGFYTWTDALKNIFKQDRLLQTYIRTSKEREALRKAIFKDKDLASAYTKMLSLIEQLNNPFPPEYCDFRQSTETKEKKCKYCFIPPSMAHETELIKRLYGNRPIPQGFSLIDALIQNIVSGDISLAPTANSGWYDHKIYALETFLLPEKMPEAAKLQFGKGYKKELVKLFKGILALTRETHIKSLEIPLCGAAMPEKAIDIYPELSLEPIATYYLRLGKSYSFIRDVLQTYFSDPTLMEALRLMPDGDSQKPLLNELMEIESLMYGLFLITAEEIGMVVKEDVINRKPLQIKRDRHTAQTWIKSHRKDPDLGVDSRMMVPVFYDEKRKKIKVWVVLGYSVKPVTIAYEKKPTYSVTDTNGKTVKRKVKFHKQKQNLIYPVSAEVYTRKILDRKEFRALCNKYKTQKKIMEAIKNLN